MLRHIRNVRILLLALLALLAAVALVAPASAQSTDRRIATESSLPDADIGYTMASYPALTGRVVDAAGVLDPANRKALVARLEALEAATGDQLVVATVAALHGNSIESYANRLFNIWKLGQKDKNNGVLLLVAPAERKVRIEVGFGLEGRLTDAVTKLIIEQSIVPHFRSGDFAAGITRAADDIASVLTGDAGAWQARAELHREVVARHSLRAEPHVINLPPVLGVLLMIVTYGGGALMVALAAYIVIFGIARFLIAIHLLPQRRQRTGAWRWLNVLDNDRYDSRGGRVSASSASGSSGASSSFSGGGGSSGGGCASGSW
jgi:uncharacterized protein